MNYFRAERARCGGGSTPQPGCAISSPHHLCSHWADRKQQSLIIRFSLAGAWSRISLLFVLQKLGRWCGWREPLHWQNVGRMRTPFQKALWPFVENFKVRPYGPGASALTFCSIPPFSRGHSPHSLPCHHRCVIKKSVALKMERRSTLRGVFFVPEALNGEVVWEHPTCTKLQLKSSFLLLQGNNDRLMDDDLTFNLQL